MFGSKKSSCFKEQKWLDAFYSLRAANKPKSLSKAEWLDVQYEAFILFNMDKLILEKIRSFDWDILDIFGGHYLTPTTRVDCMGFLLLKNQQEKIVDVDNIRIQLKTKNGVTKSLYKSLKNPERVLLYKMT